MVLGWWRHVVCTGVTLHVCSTSVRVDIHNRRAIFAAHRLTAGHFHRLVEVVAGLRRHIGVDSSCVVGIEGTHLVNGTGKQVLLVAHLLTRGHHRAR